MTSLPDTPHNIIPPPAMIDRFRLKADIGNANAKRFANAFEFSQDLYAKYLK